MCTILFLLVTGVTRAGIKPRESFEASRSETPQCKHKKPCEPESHGILGGSWVVVSRVITSPHVVHNSSYPTYKPHL